MFELFLNAPVPWCVYMAMRGQFKKKDSIYSFNKIILRVYNREAWALLFSFYIV